MVNMPCLYDIPEELLEHVLLKSDVKSIVRCRQVSRRFNDLFLNSISLQYKIELVLAGLKDGSSGGMVVSERLQALRSRSAAWASGQFTPGRTCTADHSNWAFAGSHLAWMRDERQLEIIQIPCTITRVVEKSWSFQVLTVPGEIILGLAIDPSQDLLVLMKKRVFDWGVEVRSFTTGQRHLGAHQDSLSLCEISESVTLTNWAHTASGAGHWLHAIAQNIHVAYDILHEGRHSSKLIVYNWRTGHVVLNMVFSVHFGSALMSDRYLLLAHHDLHDHLILSVIDLCATKDTTMNDRDATEAKDLDAVCVLEYPIPPSPGRTRCATLVSGPPYCLNPVPTKVPFHARPERLFAVSYFIFPSTMLHADYVTSLLLSSTLDKCIRAAEFQPQHRFSWSQWGPEGTRLLPLSVLPTNLSIYGASLVTSSLPKSPDLSLSMSLQIYDLGRPGAWEWPKASNVYGDGNTLYDSGVLVPTRSPMISFQPEHMSEDMLRASIPLLGENCIVLKALRRGREQCRILSM